MGSESETNGTSSASELEALLAQLTDAVKTYKENPADKDLALRRKVCGVAEEIVNATKVPEEGCFDLSTKMAELSTVRIFMKWKVFEKIPEEGSISYKELAEQVGAEEALISRVASGALATGLLKLVGEDRVQHSRLSVIYKDNHPSGILFKIMFDEFLVPCVKWPAYFDKYGLKEPTSWNHNPHSFGYGQPEKHYWDIISVDKERFTDFNQSMNTLEQMLPITGYYDYSWLKQYADGDRPLFVDVGGGRGQAVKAIRRENPWMPAEKCTLQDRPIVIEQVKDMAEEEMKGVQLMAHDFFNEQPVKGAYVYFIRRCMHDWSDENDAIILRHLRDAMGPNSRVLITEQLMANPPTGLNAQTDMCMLNIGGKERNERMFHQLCNSAGLNVVKFHKAPGTDVAVVECEKA